MSGIRDAKAYFGIDMIDTQNGRYLCICENLYRQIEYAVAHIQMSVTWKLIKGVVYGLVLA